MGELNGTVENKVRTAVSQNKHRHKDKQVYILTQLEERKVLILLALLVRKRTLTQLKVQKYRNDCHVVSRVLSLIMPPSLFSTYETPTFPLTGSSVLSLLALLVQKHEN